MTERKIELLKTVIMFSIYEIVMTVAICAVFHGPLKAYLFFVGIAVIHSVINMIQGESYRGKNLETYSITTAANRNK